jgi:hypothetical protein
MHKNISCLIMFFWLFVTGMSAFILPDFAAGNESNANIPKPGGELVIGMFNCPAHLNPAIVSGAYPVENLDEALKAARKAAEVSRLMLTYLGQTPGKHVPIDLSENCRQRLTLLQAAAPKGMTIKTDFPASGPVILADAGQILQVLSNLINNAWEAIGENKGTIDLTVKMYYHADIPTLKRFPINWRPLEIVYACLQVSDTGHGIMNKDIERIFDPFFTTRFTGRGDEAQVMADEHTEQPNAFLGKPYQLKVLRDTINRVMSDMS